MTMLCEIPEFGRCCFCMPLRRGILVFGYLNIIFSVLMIGLYSFSVHQDVGITLVYHGVAANIEDKLCIAIYCVDILFNVLMIYGAHKKMMPYLRIFYYYTIATVAATVLLQIVSTIGLRHYEAVELVGLFLVGLSIHLYLLFLVRSLLKKMDVSGQAYENQLHQFVNGEIKIEGNVIYPSTVIPNDPV